MSSSTQCCQPSEPVQCPGISWYVLWYVSWYIMAVTFVCSLSTACEQLQLGMRSQVRLKNGRQRGIPQTSRTGPCLWAKPVLSHKGDPILKHSLIVIKERTKDIDIKAMELCNNTALQYLRNHSVFRVWQMLGFHV